MSEIIIAIPNDAVTEFVAEMSVFNPVVCDWEHSKSPTDIVTKIKFDVAEVTALFIMKVFFAGMRCGIKTMREDYVCTPKPKNNIL
jgi:hypothetical protein